MPSRDIPTVAPKKSYGAVRMTPVLDLFTKEGQEIFGTPQTEFTQPPTFEALGLPNWLVLYEAYLPFFENSQNLSLGIVTKDRALVYINNILSGTLNRGVDKYNMSYSTNQVNQVQFLVENMGRVNYGDTDVEDFKVIKKILSYTQMYIHLYNNYINIKHYRVYLT